MKRWLFGLTALILVALVPIGAGAQGKDTLTVALPNHPPTLDPHMHFERVGVLVNINMFDSLLHRSAKLEFEPSLALSWKALNDTTWEFKLRKGVKFHDGSTMTAEDVKYSFDRVLEPGKEKKKSPQYGNVRAIKEVKIVDADTIHLITDKPFPLLLERLVFFPIVPKKHIEKVGDEAFGSTATVGTGPWKLVEWKRDQHIRLEAFDQHWRGKPAFKYVVFRAIPEVATQVAELKTGGVDIIRNVNADLLPDIKSHPQTRISTTPILRVHYISLDMRSAPFDKKAARQAANYAIDKQAIIQKMMAGLGKQVPTVVQPPAFGFDASVPAVPVRSEEGQGAPGAGRLPQRRRHHAAQLVDGLAPASSRPWAQMLTEVGLRTTVKMWDPGPAWNKFFQAEGKAHPRRSTATGATTRCSTPTPCCTRSTTRSPAAGSASTTRGSRASTSSSTRRARPSTRPKRKQIYARIQRHDPRRGAVGLPVDAERHARHLEEGRVRGAAGRVALALRGQAAELSG